MTPMLVSWLGARSRHPARSEGWAQHRWTLRSGSCAEHGWPKAVKSKPVGSAAPVPPVVDRSPSVQTDNCGWVGPEIPARTGARSVPSDVEVPCAPSGRALRCAAPLATGASSSTPPSRRSAGLALLSPYYGWVGTTGTTARRPIFSGAASRDNLSARRHATNPFAGDLCAHFAWKSDGLAHESSRGSVAVAAARCCTQGRGPNVS